MTVIKTIPAGYWEDPKGHLIPEEQVKDVDKLRDALVNTLVKDAQDGQEYLKCFKKTCIEEIQIFLALSAEEYGVKMGGTKGNLTLVSFNGRYKVKLAIADKMSFDERLQVAKALIDECIQEWSKDSRPEIRVLINDAFDVDKEGNLNVGRILSLRRLAIKDPRWVNAMEAISDSLTVTGSKSYVRMYERREDGGWDQISLDFAKF